MYNCNKRIIVIAFLIMFLLPSALGKDKVAVSLNIPSQYKAVNVGETILIQTEVILIKDFTEEEKVTDVLLEYAVKDSKGNTIISFSETKGTILRLDTLKEVSMPKDSPPGIYVVEVKASYRENIGMDTELFEVQNEQSQIQPLEQSINSYLTAIIAILLMVMISLYYSYRRIKNKRENW